MGYFWNGTSGEFLKEEGLNLGLGIGISQVSTKQSELGIGQSELTHDRFKLVDFLPPMSANAYFITSRKPKAITTYDTITIPFDKYVWLFIFVSIIAQFILLVIMQHCYSHVTGTENVTDYIYEGNLDKSSSKSPKYNTF